MDIKILLQAWGRGRALNQAPNGYPPQSAFAKEMRQPGDGFAHNRLRLPDEDIKVIDAVISRLKIRKPDQHKVIVCAYARGMLDHQISKSQSFDGVTVSRSWVRAVRENAEHWLEAKLEDYLD